jgi:glycosyltransferase involved in cell wall biosynthesis
VNTHGGALRADIVNRRHVPKDLVEVIPAGIAAGPPPRPPFSRPGASPVIGTLGEVERAEIQRDFVRAAKEVLARVPDAQFLIVGQGADPRALRSLIRDLGLASSFTFTNVIDHRKVLPEMDICVMPSLKEGPGQAILEAMAAARPVIATGAGGAFEVIRDEETGLLVEKGHPEDLAQAILRLLLDRALARRIGLRAREVVLERYPLERMIDETLGIYARAGAGTPA